MPNYLERVVTSGTRRSPTVRPPLTIVPPLPVLGQATMAIEAPGNRELSSSEPGPSIPDVGEMVSPTPPPPTSPAPDIPHALPAEQAAAIGTSRSPAVRLEAVARPGHGREVIRAPRGLRPETMASAAAPVMASSETMASTDAPVTASSEASVIAPPPVPVSSRPLLPASSRDPFPAAEESARLVRPRIGVEIAAAPRLSEAAPDSAPSHDVAREPPMHQGPLSGPLPRAVATPPSAWLRSVRPPMASAPARARTREPEHRITIGRIDVEVHNEPPPAPPPPSGPAGRAETGGLSAGVASRFLLKP
jgi:hypothetical protein